MKKILLGILIFTMAFNLVGGFSSFAAEGCNSFEDLKVSSKDKLSPNCFDKLKKKMIIFLFLLPLIIII
ncbi:MAG: hypothetical protein RUMPE_00997 [Eubacteriales bacterium SKADARSKE-1]|nr:hypothetical protein [Eubacteriales bacterium SKADARSKE-1]